MLINISCLHPSLNSWGEIQGDPDGWAFGHIIVSAETSVCLSRSVVGIGMAPCWKGPRGTCHPGNPICDCLSQPPPAVDPSGRLWSRAGWVFWLLECGTTHHSALIRALERTGMALGLVLGDLGEVEGSRGLLWLACCRQGELTP